ncbi:MAG: hypothetical protein FWD46_02340 [Cystobacterineae bacterium]|nr:hypothetical protein [Cystobacterineae bacterium]
MKKYLLILGTLLAGVAFALDTEAVPKKEAQALTQQADVIKIPSNAHSNAAAEMGIVFEWNTKQKDDCVLTVAPLANGSFYSFSLLIQSSGEYTIANIDGPGIYEVAKGNHNINMVYIVGPTVIGAEPEPCEITCSEGWVCEAETSTCIPENTCDEGWDYDLEADECVDSCGNACEATEFCEDGTCFSSTTDPDPEPDPEPEPEPECRTSRDCGRNHYCEAGICLPCSDDQQGNNNCQ